MHNRFLRLKQGQITKPLVACPGANQHWAGGSLKVCLESKIHGEGRVTMLAGKVPWGHVNSWIKGKTIWIDRIMTLLKVVNQGFAAYHIMTNRTLIHFGRLGTRTFRLTC